jgi:putative endonuclease
MAKLATRASTEGKLGAGASQRTRESSRAGATAQLPCNAPQSRNVIDPTVAAMGDLRARLGAAGERAAEEHLRRRGFRTLERNYRRRCGEIDLVCFDGTTLVFCEVKSRRAGSGLPWDALGATKQRQVRAMARQWLAERADRPSATELRFDAIGVVFDARGRMVDLEHLEAAF